MTPDEQAIRDLRSAVIAAVNAADLERLLGLMTDDAVFLNVGRVAVGKAEFSAGFLAGHRQGRLRCTSEVEEVVVVGEVAYSRSRESLCITPAGGPPDPPAVHLAGHALTVWRKQPDGRWLLARDAVLLATA